MERIDLEIIHQKLQFPDTRWPEAIAHIERFKIVACFGSPIASSVIHDYPVSFVDQNGRDLFPHAGAAEPVMEENNGITVAADLII
jgi:hypothetical protein